MMDEVREIEQWEDSERVKVGRKGVNMDESINQLYKDIERMKV